MKRKKRKIKKHYTISVTSDYSSFKTKYYRSRFNILRMCVVTMIIAVLITIGLTVFEYYQLSTIEEKLSSFRTIISEQETMIDELNKERADLKSLNEVLSATVGMQAVENEEEKKENEEKHLPSQFPLTGSAMIVEQDTEAEDYEPIIVFEMSAMSDVIAAGDGIVTSVREDSKFGTFISIDHGNGYVTIYRNAGDPKVMEGDEVVRGAIIFIGSGEGDILGYQVMQDNEFVDPMSVIEING